MLAEIGKNQVRRDGRDLIQPRLAELALDVVLGREPEPAVGLEADVGRLPGSVRRQHLGHIRFGAAGLAGIEQARGFVAHQVGGAHVGVGAGNRKLHALILTDRAIEHHALPRIAPSLVGKPVSIANALGGDQDALRVHAVQNVAEALPFFADQVLGGNFEVIEEHFVGLVIHHVADGAHREAAPSALAQIDQEHGQSLGLPLHFGQWRGARQQQHQIGMLHARDPDFLAVDDVAVALALGGGFDFGGVGAGGRLGDGEGLQAQFAGCDAAADTAASALR